MIEMLAEHKLLLSKTVSQNKAPDDLMDIIPTNSEDNLRDDSMKTQSDH